MKILNFGSLNLDYVYSLPHFVKPGETITCGNLHTGFGGKGLNQSIALARAGAKVAHAGFIGPEGSCLKNFLHENGVDTTLIREADAANGHAIIQIDENGENCIIVYGGANRMFTEEFIKEAVKILEPGDIVLLQNETNLTDETARISKEKGAKIVLNPSPIDSWLLNHFPFELVDLFILNETENTALENITRRFPAAPRLLTLGEKGALYVHNDVQIFKEAVPVKAVDTTAAGDCFTGYFLAGLTKGLPIETCLANAATAAAITVGAVGAAETIPYSQS
jgi:ribokinase